jgi:lipopolysaccharide export system permease protein
MKTRPGYTTLNVYISKEYLFAFLVAFSFFFAIFFVNQLLVIAKNILIANVSLTDVAKIILYSVPVILSFTFPFASLTGAAMALGQLSSNNEVLALRAGGISLKRIFLPVVLLSLILSLTSFILNDVFQPLGTIEYKKLYRELLYRNPSLELRANSVTRFGNTFFITGNVSGNDIDSLMILKPDSGGMTVITSRTARLEESESGSDLLNILLEQAVGFTPKLRVRDEYDFFTADLMEYAVFLDTVSYSFMSLTPNDMSIRDLYSDIRELVKENEASQAEIDRGALNLRRQAYLNYFEDFQQDLEGRFSRTAEVYSRMVTMEESFAESRKLEYYLLEFYKKSALPAACTVLVFFAFPLSALRMRNGRVVGFGVGVIASTLYWFLLFAGQTMGTRLPLPPFILLWFPNFLFLSLGLALFYLRSRR